MKVLTPPRLDRDYTSRIVDVEAYTRDHIFFSKAPGAPVYAGKVYELRPLTGGGGEFGAVVGNIFKSVPDGSVIQVSEVCAPDFDASAKFLRGKATDNAVMRELLAAQAAVLDRALKVGWQSDMPIINTKTVVITLAMPVAGIHDSDNILSEVRQSQSEFASSLKQAGFGVPTVLAPGDLVGLYRQFFKMFKRRLPALVEPTAEFRHHLFGPDDLLDFRDRDVGVINGDEEGNNGEAYCAGVTQKFYPTEVGMGLMNLVIGAPMNKGSVSEGGGERIKTPFIITTTLRVGHQRRESTRVTNAISSRVNDSQKPPPITLGTENTAEIMKDLRYLEKECVKGDQKFIFGTTQAFVFGRTREEAIEARSTLKTHLDFLKFDARVIRNDLLVRLTQALPMNFSSVVLDKLAGDAIMPSSAAACLLPIYGDFCGNVDPASEKTGAAFITRRGELFLFDPFLSQGGFNGRLYAKTGAGKTVAVLYMALCGLADGEIVHAFDTGGSMRKLCLAIGGQYIDFRLDAPNKPSLNPYTGLNDKTFAEEMEGIAALMLLMAYENDEMDDMAPIVVREAVKAAWDKKRDKAQPVDVLHAIETAANASSELRSTTQTYIAARNLVPRLKAFLDSPARGPFFKGPATLDPTADFVVYERKGLEGDPHLRECVKFFIMNTCLTKLARIRHRRKRILIDEGADDVTEHNPSKGDLRTAAALDGFYRKGRKDTVSTWFISQSPRDGATTPAGRVIRSQSDFTIVMEQNAAEILDALKEGAIGAEFPRDGYFKQMITDIHSEKRVYSELLIMHNRTYEAVRLYLDKLPAAVFSSEGKERDVVIDLMDQGVDAITAIKRVMGDKKHGRAKWLSDIIAHLMDVDGLSARQVLEEVAEQIDARQ